MLNVPNALGLEFKQRTLTPISKYIASIVKTVLEITNEQIIRECLKSYFRFCFGLSAQAVSFLKQENQTLFQFNA